jgi:hypothetical protein
MRCVTTRACYTNVALQVGQFILEGLREHGLLACLWCLAQLSSRARESFYFCESQQLFYTAESFEKRKSDVEIDLLAVVDGTTYLCESKSSSGSIDTSKFAEVAKRIRPDVAMLAVMEQESPALNAIFERITQALDRTGIKPELLAQRGASRRFNNVKLPHRIRQPPMNHK